MLSTVVCAHPVHASLLHNDTPCPSSSVHHGVTNVSGHTTHILPCAAAYPVAQQVNMLPFARAQEPSDFHGCPAEAAMVRELQKIVEQQSTLIRMLSARKAPASDGCQQETSSLTSHVTTAQRDPSPSSLTVRIHDGSTMPTSTWPAMPSPTCHVRMSCAAGACGYRLRHSWRTKCECACAMR